MSVRADPRLVWAILRKDLVEYSRDLLWVFLTVLTLGAMTLIFWMMPDSVDETITIGVAGLDETTPARALGSLDEEGLVALPFPGADALRAVIARDAEAWRLEGDVTVTGPGFETRRPAGSKRVRVDAGLALAEGFFASLDAGEQATATVFIDAAAPDEIRTSMSGLVRELAFAVSGRELPVAVPAPETVYLVLGEDRAGAQVTPRETFRPMIISLVLIMEMFGMSTLIAREIQARTLVAILVTPATSADVLIAKAIGGTLLGLSQAAILLLAIGALGAHAGLTLTLMFLGALMVSGISMLVGSAGRDFMSNLVFGFALMVPLMIPAVAALFPGTASLWIRVLPSYPLVQGLASVTTYGDGWRETVPELGALAGWCFVVAAAGWIALKRRAETL
ncbi:MAG: ABC transporter permease [Dehalococcoidia bacterium]